MGSESSCFKECSGDVVGVAPHVFIHPDDTHPFTPSWIIDQQARPFCQDSGVDGIPGHTEGLGDTRHRQMVDHQARQRPAPPTTPTPSNAKSPETACML